MIRQIVMHLLIAGWMIAAFAVGAVSASETHAFDNIGFVVYTKSLSPGTLNARWMYTEDYGGPGLATGGPKEGFTGEYHVRYFHENGDLSDEYDLIIEKTDQAYRAKWLVAGEIKAIGIGMEVDDRLMIGWRRVTDNQCP